MANNKLYAPVMRDKKYPAYIYIVYIDRNDIVHVDVWKPTYVHIYCTYVCMYTKRGSKIYGVCISMKMLSLWRNVRIFQFFFAYVIIAVQKLYPFVFVRVCNTCVLFGKFFDFALRWNKETFVRQMVSIMQISVINILNNIIYIKGPN